MYLDFRPPHHEHVPERITVIEQGDFPCDDIDEMMADIVTTSDFEGEDPENDLLYCVVFESNPRVCECYTAGAMRRTLESLNKKAKRAS